MKTFPRVSFIEVILITRLHCIIFSCCDYEALLIKDGSCFVVGKLDHFVRFSSPKEPQEVVDHDVIDFSIRTQLLHLLNNQLHCSDRASSNLNLHR